MELKNWQYVRPTGEPPFWFRPPVRGELNGFDPLTGMIIAHSPEDACALDDAVSMRKD